MTINRRQIFENLTLARTRELIGTQEIDGMSALKIGELGGKRGLSLIAPKLQVAVSFVRKPGFGVSLQLIHRTCEEEIIWFVIDKNNDQPNENINKIDDQEISNEKYYKCQN